MELFFVFFEKITNTTLIRGIELQTEKYEFGITTGGIFTILGDIIYNFDDKSLKIENPLIFMRDKEV